MHPPHLYKGIFWLDNPKLIYLGMQDQFYTFSMFDAQAWYARDVILGRIKLPSKEEMAEGRRAWVKREEALKDAFEKIDFQADYVRELCAATDYPKFDIDMTVDEFKEWEHDKEHSILGYRNKAFKSPCTGTMAPVHHTPWLEAHGRLDEDVPRGQGQGCRGIGVARGAKGPPLRAHPRLLRIVMREAHDARGQALLLAVELADLDLGADARAWVTSTRASAMVFFRIGERVALVIDADLGAADMDAVAVADRFIAFHLEADQHLSADAPCRSSQRLAADEIVVLRCRAAR